jgi:hypothetical protein
MRRRKNRNKAPQANECSEAPRPSKTKFKRTYARPAPHKAEQKATKETQPKTLKKEENTSRDSQPKTLKKTEESRQSKTEQGPKEFKALQRENANPGTH